MTKTMTTTNGEMDSSRQNRRVRPESRNRRKKNLTLQPESVQEQEAIQAHATRKFPLESDSIEGTQFVSVPAATAELSTPQFVEEAGEKNAGGAAPINASQRTPSLDEVAQNEIVVPLATAEVRQVPIWQIVTIPMAFSFGIFVLLWSVISGWFDRLIY